MENPTEKLCEALKHLQFINLREVSESLLAAGALVGECPVSKQGNSYSADDSQTGCALDFLLIRAINLSDEYSSRRILDRPILYWPLGDIFVHEQVEKGLQYGKSTFLAVETLQLFIDSFPDSRDSFETISDSLVRRGRFWWADFSMPISLLFWMPVVLEKLIRCAQNSKMDFISDGAVLRNFIEAAKVWILGNLHNTKLSFPVQISRKSTILRSSQSLCFAMDISIECFHKLKSILPVQLTQEEIRNASAETSFIAESENQIPIATRKFLYRNDLLLILLNAVLFSIRYSPPVPILYKAYRLLTAVLDTIQNAEDFVLLRDSLCEELHEAFRISTHFSPFEPENLFSASITALGFWGLKISSFK